MDISQKASKFAKIATVVANNTVCASACFIAFAAGSEKFVSYTAQVGVHGASDKAGNTAGDATVAMAKVVRNLGVSSSVIGKMVVTPPSEMVWLDPNELRSLGATMTGKPSQVSRGRSEIGIPSQVEANAKAIQAAPPDWSIMLKVALEISTEQNNGQPQVIRSCQPEFKSCYIGVT